MKIQCCLCQYNLASKISQKRKGRVLISSYKCKRCKRIFKVIRLSGN